MIRTLFRALLGVLLLMSLQWASAAGQECIFCHPCEDGIYTSIGPSPDHILYVDQSQCMVYEEGCNGAIPCQSELADVEDALSAFDLGDWEGVARFLERRPEGLELVVERGVLLFKGCSRFIALRQVDPEQIQLVTTMHENAGSIDLNVLVGIDSSR